MSLHIKEGGVWVEASRPYVKRNGAWTAAREVYVKRNGIWTQAYQYDVTPPDVPSISLEIVDTNYWEGGQKLSGRHIKVGVRSPAASHDSDLKRIRVLSTYNDKPPTTQFGGTYTSKADDSDADEPWSDYHFNGFGSSRTTKDSSVWRYKTWPRSATRASQLEGQKHYYFTAWAEDLDGNWSAGNAAQIWVPRKNKDAADRIIKEARFQANSAGTWRNSQFNAGQLVQNSSPRARGIWFYGNQIRSAIGAQGSPSVRTAQILVMRQNDTGRPNANVYLYYHDYTTPASITGAFDPQGGVKLGTIGKGETKWFDLPDSYKALLESDSIWGFGLNYKDPNKATAAAADYSIVKPLSENLRSGELHVVWTEAP